MKKDLTALFVLLLCSTLISCNNELSSLNSESILNLSDESIDNSSLQNESSQLITKSNEEIVKEIYYNSIKEDYSDISLEDVEIRLFIELGKYRDCFAAIIKDDVNKKYGYEDVNGLFYYIYGEPIKIYTSSNCYDLNTALNVNKIITKEEVDLIYNEYIRYVNGIDEYNFEKIDESILENINITKDTIQYYLGEYSGKHIVVVEGDIPQVGFNKLVTVGNFGFLSTTLVNNLSFIHNSERYGIAQISELGFTDVELLEIYNKHAYIVNKELYNKYSDNK